MVTTHMSIVGSLTTGPPSGSSTYLTIFSIDSLIISTEARDITTDSITMDKGSNFVFPKEQGTLVGFFENVSESFCLCEKCEQILMYTLRICVWISVFHSPVTPPHQGTTNQIHTTVYYS